MRLVRFVSNREFKEVNFLYSYTEFEFIFLEKNNVTRCLKKQFMTHTHTIYYH